MLDAGMTRLEESAVAGLKAGLRGALIQPSDQSYEAACKVYNAMIDRYPQGSRGMNRGGSDDDDRLAWLVRR